MRAKEFISETNIIGKIPKDLKNAGQGSIRMRDRGGYDRAYHMNRIGMAVAMADGKNKKPVDMDAASFAQTYNIAFPYTDIEELMMYQAMATVPTDKNELAKRSKSIEASDTNIVSPISNWMTNK